MDQNTAVNMLASLASGVRLDVYRLLVKYGQTGLVANEIATELDLPPSNLSFHFKAMTYAGLISAEQEGRFMRYRANLPVLKTLIAYLTEECCQGNPDSFLDKSGLIACRDLS